MSEKGGEGDRGVAIGFVLYQPMENVIARLELAWASGFSIFVFDNSPCHGLVRAFCKARGGCTYMTCGKNVGLGIGISAICAQAYYEGFRALLFFDQDTVFSADTLTFIDQFYVEHRDLESRYSAVVFNADDIATHSEGNVEPVRDVLLAISSGSLFFLENARRIGWHNETYFVDWVDYEFCLNSYNHKLRIGEYSRTPGFDHQTEQPDRGYMIFGKQWRLRKYPTGRFWQTVVASLRLLLTSLRTGNIRFFLALARSLSIYVSFQLLIRLILLFRPA